MRGGGGDEEKGALTQMVRIYKKKIKALALYFHFVQMLIL